MTDNKVERTVVCESENCTWQEMNGANQSYWQFSPDNLSAQEIWSWQNLSLNKLLLTFELKGQNLFYAHYQNLLGLSLVSKINGEEKKEKEIIIDWLDAEKNQFNLEIEASSEAELIWSFSHPLWNYLKSQQIKNQVLTYDWIIKIEATDSAQIIEEENEASNDGEINLENETKMETGVVEAKEENNQQTENTNDQNKQTDQAEETDQSETDSLISDSASEKDDLLKNNETTIKTEGKIAIKATPKPQVLGATTLVETESRKNKQLIWGGIILSLLMLLLIFSWFKLKKKHSFNYKKQLQKFFLLQKK